MGVPPLSSATGDLATLTGIGERDREEGAVLGVCRVAALGP